MFKFNYSKYKSPGAYFRGGGGLIHGMSFLLVPTVNTLGLEHGGAYYQNLWYFKDLKNLLSISSGI